MDYFSPGSSVHGVLQARILEWVVIVFSRASSPPKDRMCISCGSGIGRQILYQLSHPGSPWTVRGDAINRNSETMDRMVP